MNFLDFWKKYESATELISLVDDLILVLKQDLKEYDEEYGIGETVFDFLNDMATANEYEKILELSRIFKEYHPKIYQDESTYINTMLITYGLYNEDKALIEESLKGYLSGNNTSGFMEKNLFSILYFGHPEIVNNVLEELTTDNLMEASLKTLKEGLRLETYLSINEETNRESQSNVTHLDLPPFSEILESLVYSYKNGLSLFQEKYGSRLPKNRKSRKEYLWGVGLSFARSMESKGCPISISWSYWKDILEYYEQRKVSNLGRYFKLDMKSYDKYLGAKWSLFRDSSPQIPLLLWLGSHFLDFQQSNGLIDDQEYKSQIKIINELKTSFKESFSSRLWAYRYIHNWSKSNYETDEYYGMEREQFINSFNIKEIPQRKPYFEIENPLLGTTQSKEIKEDIPMNMNEVEVDKSIASEKVEELKDNKVELDHQIGRNERVNVEYSDGRVVESIKYKKVIRDLEKGLCKLV